MARVFSYVPDRLLSELSVRLYDKDVYLGTIYVRFAERNNFCEVAWISFLASHVGSLVGFSVRSEIDCALRAAENLTRGTITVEQLNNSELVGELFD